MIKEIWITRHFLLSQVLSLLHLKKLPIIINIIKKCPGKEVLGANGKDISGRRNMNREDRRG